MSGRVLIVEDEAATASYLSGMARQAGLETDVADTAAAFRAYLAGKRPAAILLDIMLPDGDGRDLLRDLSALSFDGPVALCSAHGGALIEEAAQIAVSGGLRLVRALPKPLDPDAMRSAFLALSPDSDRADRAARILVVEDDFMQAYVVRLYLEAEGFEVCGTAHDGATAIRMGVQQRPDLVVSDIDLGQLPDGIDVAARLWAGHGIRTIFLTGRSDPATRTRATEAGAVDFHVKPIAGRTLADSIRRSLANSAYRSRTPPPPAMAVPDVAADLDVEDGSGLSNSAATLARAADEMGGDASDEITRNLARRLQQAALCAGGQGKTCPRCGLWDQPADCPLADSLPDAPDA